MRRRREKKKKRKIKSRKRNIQGEEGEERTRDE